MRRDIAEQPYWNQAALYAGWALPLLCLAAALMILFAGEATATLGRTLFVGCTAVVPLALAACFIGTPVVRRRVRMLVLAGLPLYLVVALLRLPLPS